LILVVNALYVTDTLKNKLHLSVIKVKLEHLRHNIVMLCKLLLQKIGSSEYVSIQALTFSNICFSLRGRIDLDMYPSLCELDLADYTEPSTHNSIDILVGTDYYWSLVTGEL